MLLCDIRCTYFKWMDQCIKSGAFKTSAIKSIALNEKIYKIYIDHISCSIPDCCMCLCVCVCVCVCQRTWKAILFSALCIVPTSLQERRFIITCAYLHAKVHVYLQMSLRIGNRVPEFYHHHCISILHYFSLYVCLFTFILLLSVSCVIITDILPNIYSNVWLRLANDDK